jgi:hypothetical protein
LPLLVDSTELPLLRLSYAGAYTDVELTSFLSALDAILESPGRKACLIDLLAAKPGSAKQRQMQGAWISAHEKELKGGFVAAAIVTDSAIIRGTVTAVFWVHPLPFPTHVAATLQQAGAWLAPYLAKI